jgi:hypothetical protein
MSKKMKILAARKAGFNKKSEAKKKKQSQLVGDSAESPAIA